VLSLTYLSSAVDLLTPDELARLFTEARDKNARLGVSGMLLHAGGNFIQTIEGPDETVDALFSLIDADERHHEVFLVLRDGIDQRAFADWQMGFVEMPRDDALRIPGFTDYLHTGVIEGDDGCRRTVMTFHRVFREMMG
jgi:hypothetical protein